MLYLDTSAAAHSPFNGGIPRTMRRLYRTLQQTGQVTPLVWSEAHRTYCLLSVSEKLFLERPFQRHSRPCRDPSDVGRQLLRRLRRRFNHRRTAMDFDEICRAGHTLVMPEICEAARRDWLERAAASGRLRMVAIFHDAIPFLRPDLTLGFKRGFDDYLRCLARFNTVVTCSAESRDRLIDIWQRLGSTAAPVIVEPWPTDFGSRGTADPARFDQPRVLFVSTLEPRKNHLTLLAAYEQLWNEGFRFDLELIGRELAGSRTSHALVESIRRLRRQGRRVKWHGHVSDDALVSAYRECSFTVYPSLMEGFGLPIHESLWFGRPCVCGANGALGEVSTGGGCLTCDQTQVGSLAEAMRRLLTDRGLYEKLSKEAAIRQFRSWMDYARSLRQLLAGC
jgi:glycosyltransferase involved in cell wall biosynthesis